ncbi:hypothetical protein [Legionella clemsonensis]|uniref:Uncharacterized protein n=1 Tax=Legionella clemsonensis TaxID=1867846 RepID=A0A222P183_9GAMM|nr:hypothetical protein [Legionella clemsonensis]ASQ45535.1 hypothetical protein clem_04885 [Legionella clemsonensis]
MSNPALLKFITTPHPALIRQLEQAEPHNFDGIFIKAVPLAGQGNKEGGGFSEGVYLYQNEQGEYRVLKVLAKKQMNLYGGINRKIESFNQMYQSIYKGEFAELATAKFFGESGRIIDMPYINGEDIKIDTDFNIVDDGPQKKLYEFFDESGFFITDYRISGNVVQVTDDKGKSYFLIRDVDLLGRRKSFEVTPELLEEELHSSYKEAHNHLAKEEYIKLKTIHSGERIFQESKALSSTRGRVDSDFLKLQEALLTAMKANKITDNVYERIAQAKDFPELCDAACQHTTKPFLFSGSNFLSMTKTMDLLRKELKKNEYYGLKSDYDFKNEKMLNVQLRSIGATSKNILKNEFAKNQTQLKTARDFFRELYYPAFDAKKRQAIKSDLGDTRAIFNEKSYINELKFKLNNLKQNEQTQNTEGGAQYISKFNK